MPMSFTPAYGQATINSSTRKRPEKNKVLRKKISKLSKEYKRAKSSKKQKMLSKYKKEFKRNNPFVARTARRVGRFLKHRDSVDDYIRRKPKHHRRSRRG